MEIPIQNLYFMLCYAWDNLDTLKVKNVHSAQADNVTDLFGRVLREAVNDIIKPGLWRNYVESIDELPAIKGKLILSASIGKGLLHLGRAVCLTDEYSINNRPNQLILATLKSLASVKKLNPNLRHDLLNLAQQFRGVDDIKVNSDDFLTITTSRLNNKYALLMRICSLIWKQLAPSDICGRFKFEEFHRSPSKMREVFEAFVRNFYKIELANAQKVKSEKLYWDTPDGVGDKRLLPIMKTDTSIIALDSYTVIETKFVPEAMKLNRYGSEKLRSSHLYQLMAYLESIRRATLISPRGILLYPRVDYDIYESYQLWGFDVQILTIDLMQDWADIRDFLLTSVKLGQPMPRDLQSS